GAPAVRVVIGAEAHTSVVKALRLAGFGEAQIERVPTDEVGAIDADAFPETDELTLVVLQAGNVNTGASDPFERIIPSAREANSWVHVDGAFGLWAAASPTRRRLVAGVELADSWATDGHKWLNVPYDSGIVIVREVEHLTRAMRADASYLVSGQGLEPLSRGIQMSQRGRGVEAWAALASLGRHGLADLIDRTCDHAARFARLLAEGGAEILAQELNQVLVSFGDLTDAVIAAVQAEGTCWAGGSTWHGHRAMRISVSDAATTRDDVEGSARDRRDAVRSLRSEFPRVLQELGEAFGELGACARGSTWLAWRRGCPQRRSSGRSRRHPGRGERARRRPVPRGSRARA